MSNEVQTIKSLISTGREFEALRTAAKSNKFVSDPMIKAAVQYTKPDAYMDAKHSEKFIKAGITYLSSRCE